ncbi:TPA: LOW QUALITY PROTEIN: hypothetical protein N0F65_012088 [Lagenidium giganteum]|uniref:Uncharacterized protein n=1 Tax=Lagenidium giganteum TaxID=4803 RepID=A0AAV2YH80_9STRA|nr:TPA: LOW QUALITY PROTEIN: hypothetical protein N0F65_012088 [Lagenidium giganteum]
MEGRFGDNGFAFECALRLDGTCNTYTGAPAFQEKEGIDFFRSSTTKYCSSRDAACNSCRQTNKHNASASSESDRVCRGLDGCICINMCRATRSLPICSLAPTLARGDQVSTPSPTLLVWFGVSLLLWVVIIGWQRRRSTTLVTMGSTMARGRPVAQPRPMPPTTLSAAPTRSVPLTLAGWKAMRTTLIDNEHSTLAATSLPPPQERNVDISPASVTVEHGYALHPSSPRTTRP